VHDRFVDRIATFHCNIGANCPVQGSVSRTWRCEQVSSAASLMSTYHTYQKLGKLAAISKGWASTFGGRFWDPGPSFEIDIGVPLRCSTGREVLAVELL
jgi:hypothetical protein